MKITNHKFTHRKIVLYDKQRQIVPLINSINKKSYLFINSNYLWILLKPLPNSKFKSRVILTILWLIRPKIIISYDWLTKYQKLYFFWTKKHKREFIVIQHGAYFGGKITVVQCKFSRCTTIYCWSEYFKNEFENFNKGKKISVINFGNPIFNSFNRNDFAYTNKTIKNILFLPTLIKNPEILEKYSIYINSIQELGLDISIKPHPMQTQFEKFNAKVVSNEDIYQILLLKEFDIVISDNSTSLLDAIFFKYKVLFFDPTCANTIYAKFLHNIFNAKEITTLGDFESQVDISAQEKLLSYLAGGKNITNQLISSQQT